MNKKYLSVIVIVLGSLLVSIPFINRKIQGDNYLEEIKAIQQYIDTIISNRQSCTIELGENRAKSDCGEKIILSDHIMIEPTTISYVDGVFEGEELVLIGSNKYREQYCLGLSGVTTALGNDECNNVQNP